MNSKLTPGLHRYIGCHSIVVSARRYKCGVNPAIRISVVPTGRHYARQTRRTTVVEEEQRVNQQTGTGVMGRTEQTKDDLHRPWHEPEPEQESDLTTEETITPEISAHLNKVYGTMLAGVGACAVGATASMIVPPLAGIGFIGALISIFALMFTPREKISLRTSLFVGVTGLLGLSIGPLCAASSAAALFAASLGTAGIFGGFSFMALKAKSRSMLKFGGPLLGCLLALVLCSLGGMFLPMLGVTSPAILGALHSLNLYGGLALFSFYVSYDTQLMIENYRAGDNDHLTPALNMFLNVFNIFVRLLTIFRD